MQAMVVALCTLATSVFAYMYLFQSGQLLVGEGDFLITYYTALILVRTLNITAPTPNTSSGHEHKLTFVL